MRQTQHHTVNTACIISRTWSTTRATGVYWLENCRRAAEADTRSFHQQSFIHALRIRAQCSASVSRHNALTSCRRFPHWSRSTLVPNSTTRTPATDMLYNTTNGRAHNNSATYLVAQQNHHQRTKIATSQHLDMLGSGIAMWQIFVRLVVNLLYNKL